MVSVTLRCLFVYLHYCGQTSPRAAGIEQSPLTFNMQPSHRPGLTPRSPGSPWTCSPCSKASAWWSRSPRSWCWLWTGATGQRSRQGRAGSGARPRSAPRRSLAGRTGTFCSCWSSSCRVRHKMAPCAGRGTAFIEQVRFNSKQSLTWKQLRLTWDLLKSSPDWDEYVPMKYGIFFSDPEIQNHSQERRNCGSIRTIPSKRYENNEATSFIFTVNWKYFCSFHLPGFYILDLKQNFMTENQMWDKKTQFKTQNILKKQTWNR